MIFNLITKIRTAHSLGFSSLGRYCLYKIGLLTGINPVTRLTANINSGLFYDDRSNDFTNLEPNHYWLEQALYFGWKNFKISSPPNWYFNPFEEKTSNSKNNSWWEIKDFAPETGDIKTIWEASRFDWAVIFAQNIASGNKEHSEKLNSWLNNWVKNNRPYNGANWKCGQEASIRVIHLALSAFILNQIQDTQPTLISLIKAHLQRIAPTIQYAIAQDNNHGTSEAAALFIGGSWLMANNDSMGKKWCHMGKKWLENRARKLIDDDGSFSQYSLNYHRLMLDTFSFAEIWRQELKLKPFSSRLIKQMRKAANWLFQMVQPLSGDAPNLGANDGARILPLTSTDYRDFRPSVQLGMVVFNKYAAYSGNGNWNLPLEWLKQEIPQANPVKLSSVQYRNGGYSLLRKGKAFALLRFPSFRFRPSHSDALHLDFWVAGENILRDGGTFSYAASQEKYNYFSGAASHNTIQFDNRDQMPRLGRFLYGNWLRANTIEPVLNTENYSKCSASYKDSFGAMHLRSVILSEKQLFVEDKATGFKKIAILRWRLKPGKWQVQDNAIFSENISLKVNADTKIQRFELTEGLESRYYYQKTSIPVLEIEIAEPGTIKTEINLLP